LRLLVPAIVFLCSAPLSAALYTVDIYGVVEESGTALQMDVPDPGPLGLGGDLFHWRFQFDSMERHEGRILVQDSYSWGTDWNYICDAPAAGGHRYEGENCQANPSDVIDEDPVLGHYRFELRRYYSHGFSLVVDLDTLAVEYMDAGAAHPAVPSEFWLQWVPFANQNVWSAFGTEFYREDPNASPLNYYGGYPYATGSVTQVTLTSDALEPVPEPGTIGLSGLAIIGLMAWRRVVRCHRQ
jgi:PEP-CTERM motif